ncbi:MAG TPA: protease pro-enzyme activation domain-containing protein [Nitrososphaerales archaeon]|nr:protease pro-enzyme activation domain-containing protein [Nitrososphaerales archaeon]
MLQSGAQRGLLRQVLAVAVVLALALPALTSIQVGAVSSPSSPAAPVIHGFKPLGAASPDMPIIATLALPLRNTALLDSLVMQVSDPTSPAYRHFLTPQQVKSEFLPVAAYDSLLSYLNGTGLKVVLTALDSEVVVQGTVAQFRSAFGGAIATYSNGTYSYYASTGSTTFDGAYVYASNATLLLTKPAIATSQAPSSNVTFTEGTFNAKELAPVYNASYYYAHGETGEGETIGLLDFYGSPTIASDLAKFDRTFGFPDATLKVVPVGPYDPSLGALVGWSTEVSLDVEASHAMAPGASIELYVANGALPLSVPLAKIVQDDSVTTLSQSFGDYEWYYSITSDFGGPSFMELNALIPDQYYALGSIEGITFSASSGDGGGSGYSSGPEGSLEYPATSPFVTSVGGTQTYFSASADGAQEYTQTAWSNIGFVPNLVNEGGGGGGVSIIEPKPWYQSQQVTPPSYPNGRLNPDLSLQAGIDPSIQIVDSGNLVGTGGTSESSPLLAGLMTLVAQSVKGHLGLINPLLYQAGNNAAEYRKAFTPITFGYIIPWTASEGYNLATGWGAPNVGGLGGILNSTSSQPQLTVHGEIINSTGMGQEEFTQNEALTVNAQISEGRGLVSAGAFTLSLVTLQGASSPVSMSYNSATGNWTGTITMGEESGLAYVYLAGQSGDGTPGRAIGTIFAGYLGSFAVYGEIYSLSFDPWTWSKGAPLTLVVATTDLNGKPAPQGSLQLEVEPYSISDNMYATAGSATLVDSGSGQAKGNLTSPVPPGPLSLILRGDTYGYAPTVYGIYLQTSYIYPEVAAEPGSVAPGQSLTIVTTPIAPVNVYFETPAEGPPGYYFAYDVAYGSNVTASLVSPSGSTVSTATLALQSCAQALRVCNGGADMIYGQLPVPPSATSGLYTVRLDASYSSLTPGGNLTGNFYGQVWVSAPMIKPSISVEPGSERVSPDSTVGQASDGQAGMLFQGEPAHVVAKIDYSNGTAVRFGEYTAFLYPASLAGEYATLMHQEYAAGALAQLAYDPGLGAWVGNVTLPSPADQGGLSGLGLNTLDYSGPYDVYVTGVSADGVPTSAAIGAQQAFYIQPYVYYAGASPLPTGPQVAFDGSQLPAAGTLTGDLFIGSNRVTGGNITISDSQIQGSITVANSTVTLVGVTGGNINATGSRLVLKDSTIGALRLVGSNVSLVDSSYSSVDPALPSVSISGLSNTIHGVGAYNVTISGEDLASSYLAAWIDGSKVGLNPPVAAGPANSTQSNVTAKGTIDATSLDDGVHTLTVTVTQADGLSSTLSAQFSTDAHQMALQNQTTQLYDFAYLLVALVAAAIIVGSMALVRVNRARQPAATAPHV